MKVLITGASGLVGTHLEQVLKNDGHTIVKLSRYENKAENTYRWDYTQSFIDISAFENVTHIVHLAGAGIADKRWTANRKKEILESRVRTTELLLESVQKLRIKLDTFVTASAIGIYNHSNLDHWVDESQKPAESFLSQVVQKWENAADAFEKIDARVVKLRIGIVLARESGALPVMIKPIKWGLTAALGSGKQYMSWIHIDDLVQLFYRATKEQNIKGVYNAVTPHPVTNQEFTQILSSTLHKPYFLPNVPAPLIKMVMGDMSDLVTLGVRVSANKLLKTGFRFKYETIQSALSDLTKKD